MKVTNVRICCDEAGSQRLTADVRYSDRARRNTEETIWFEVDGAFAEPLSERADPWICCMLPLAAMHDDSVIQVEGTASRRLLKGASSILTTWKSWYPELRDDVTIECDEVTDAPEQSKSESGLFFSGGVDSWFSLLFEEANGRGVDCLVSVMGFDIRLPKRDAIAGMIWSHRSAAAAMKKDLVIVKTNLRDTRFGERSWGPLTHGAALATVAHILAPRFTRLLIAATHSFANLRPWGSHPANDPLFSSDTLEIVHHGLEFNRVERTRLLANHQVALDHLHVCWQSHDDTNCGKCEKCLRTMVALELYGVLAQSPAFPIDHVSVGQFGRIKATSPGVRHWMTELKILAKENQCPDLAEAIGDCIRKGRKYAWLRNCVPDVIGGRNGLLGRPLRKLWKRI